MNISKKKVKLVEEIETYNIQLEKNDKQRDPSIYVQFKGPHIPSRWREILSYSILSKSCIGISKKNSR